MADAQLEILFKIVADKVGADEANRLMAGLRRETGEAGEEAHKFTLKGHELRELMHALNRITPGLGMLLKAAFNPEIIGIVALVVLIEKFTEHIKKAREEAQKLREEEAVSWKSMTDAVQAFYEKVEEADRKFAEQFQTMLEAQNSLEANVKRITTAIDQEKEALIAMSKARGDDKKVQEEIALIAEKSAIAAKSQQLTTQQAAQPGLDAAARKAREAAEGPMGAHFAATLHSIDVAISKMSEDMKKAKTDEERDKLIESIQGLREDKLRLEGQQREAEQQRDKAQAAALKSQETIAALQAELQAMRAHAGVTEIGVTAAQGGLTGIVLRGVDAIKAAREHGGKVSQEQGQAIAGLNAVLSAIGQANKSTVDAIVASTSNLEAFNAQMQAIKAKQDKIAQQLGVL